MIKDQARKKFPKHALNYKPRGRRDRGRPRKRWQRVDAGTGQTNSSMDDDDDDELIPGTF
jgi:predicted ArsR family transcriptional regulator